MEPKFMSPENHDTAPYDQWFAREVVLGLAEADRGELVDHADVRRMIEARYPAG